MQRIVSGVGPQSEGLEMALLSLLVGLAAADEWLSLVRLAASASSIGAVVQKRVRCVVVVTAREDP